MNDVIGSDPPQGPEHPPTLEEFLRGLDVSGWAPPPEADPGGCGKRPSSGWA